MNIRTGDHLEPRAVKLGPAGLGLVNQNILIPIDVAHHHQGMDSLRTQGRYSLSYLLTIGAFPLMPFDFLKEEDKIHSKRMMESVFASAMLKHLQAEHIEFNHNLRHLLSLTLSNTMVLSHMHRDHSSGKWLWRTLGKKLITSHGTAAALGLGLGDFSPIDSVNLAHSSLQDVPKTSWHNIGGSVWLLPLCVDHCIGANAFLFRTVLGKGIYAQDLFIPDIAGTKWVRDVFVKWFRNSRINRLYMSMADHMNKLPSEDQALNTFKNQITSVFERYQSGDLKRPFIFINIPRYSVGLRLEIFRWLQSQIDKKWGECMITISPKNLDIFGKFENVSSQGTMYPKLADFADQGIYLWQAIGATGSTKRESTEVLTSVKKAGLRLVQEQEMLSAEKPIIMFTDTASDIVDGQVDPTLHIWKDYQIVVANFMAPGLSGTNETIYPSETAIAALKEVEALFVDVPFSNHAGVNSSTTHTDIVGALDPDIVVPMHMKYPLGVETYVGRPVQDVSSPYKIF